MESLNVLETNRTSERIACDCSEAFIAPVVRVINVQTDPKMLEELLSGCLNRVRCGHCQREFPSDTPVYIHDPEGLQYVCLFPAAWRSKELDLRIQFYQELLGAGAGTVPGYVRDARFVFGLEPCAKLLGREGKNHAPKAADPVRSEKPAAVQELREADFEQVADVERIDRRDAALVERWRETGQQHYTFADEGAFHIFLRHREPESLGDHADLLFQLQRIENFPLIVMLMVAETKTGSQEVLYWLFNLDNKVDVKFLEQLSVHFDVRLHLFDEEYHRKRILVFTPPLEHNVAYVLDEARKWLEQIEPGRRNFFIAASKFDDKAYDRLGQHQHAPKPAAFRDLPTPSVTKLALEILTYWSSRNQYEYLIFIKSFPVETFKSILSDVLSRALFFGLAMTEKMKRMVVELGLAASKEELVLKLLSNFSELSAGNRPNDLDPQASYENWQQLIQDAGELGIEVNASFMNLTRKAQQTLQESKQAISLDLSDDVEMLGTLDQLNSSELLVLLEEKEHRVEAAKALAETGRDEFFQKVAWVFHRMALEEVDELGDSLAAFGEKARGFIIQALEGKRKAQAIGAIRALVRLDGAASVPRLLKEITEGRPRVWKEAYRLLKQFEIPVAAALEASRHPDAAVRKRIISVLAVMRDSETLSRLERLVASDENSKVRQEANRALSFRKRDGQKEQNSCQKKDQV
jgi:hypothetical protein